MSGLGKKNGHQDRNEQKLSDSVDLLNADRGGAQLVAMPILDDDVEAVTMYQLSEFGSLTGKKETVVLETTE